jgi:hypothetical protein
LAPLAGKHPLRRAQLAHHSAYTITFNKKIKHINKKYFLLQKIMTTLLCITIKFCKKK